MSQHPHICEASSGHIFGPGWHMAFDFDKHCDDPTHAREFFVDLAEYLSEVRCAWPWAEDEWKDIYHYLTKVANTIVTPDTKPEDESLNRKSGKPAL